MPAPDEFRFTITGTGRIEEEEEEKKTRGRPSAWWAEHKSDVQDASDRAATFDGAVRGVRQGTHGGEKQVTSADVIGDLTLCWCGLPFDHDWPGKDRGRKHPREVSGMTATTGSTQQRIERRQLRAYNDDLVDVIVEAVNGYGARYRMQKNGVVLFPPDGTQGITMNARASSNQVKSARLWFLRHCVGVGEDGKPENPLVADTEVLTEDRAKRVERINAEGRKEAAELLDSMKTGSSVTEPAGEAAEPTTEAEFRPTAKVSDGPMRAPDEEPWIVYVDSKGEDNEFFETNGTVFRCKVCNGTPDSYETENPRGIGGHIRIKHRDNSTMYDEEARAKALESRRLNRLTKDVERAVGLLSASIGMTIDTSVVDALKAENAALVKRAEEAEARLALMREALGA